MKKGIDSVEREWYINEAVARQGAQEPETHLENYIVQKTKSIQASQFFRALEGKEEKRQQTQKSKTTKRKQRVKDSESCYRD